MKQAQLISLAVAGVFGLGAVFMIATMNREKVVEKLPDAPSVASTKVLVASKEIGLGEITTAATFRWQGAVANPMIRDEDTDAIRAFNRRLKDDPRVFPSLLPIGDGLSLALKL